MKRRAAILLVLGAALVAGPAGADTVAGKKASVDARIAELQARADATRAREQQVQSEIASYTSQIEALSRQVGDVSQRMAPLERELQLRELKLNRLNELYGLQVEQLRVIRITYAIALERLNQRVRDLYTSDDTDPLAVILTARDFTDLLDRLDYLQQIGDSDRQIADSVVVRREEVQAEHARTAAAKRQVEQTARVIAVRVHQVRELRDRLARSKAALEGAQADKKAKLSELSADARADAEEIDSLQQVSAELAARIRAAQGPAPTSGGVNAGSESSSRSSAPSSPGSGFIWPAAGPVSSPFGWRWGRMHEGLDIAAGYGSAIHAAASGRVIWAGWMGGYGNLVVVDHGNGYSTAYGHQSRIAVSVGQEVAQGEVIGYVGSTGHSTGPHLHFEVRINGAPADPLAYL